MCDMLSSIGNSATNFFNTSVSFAGQAASSTYEFGGQIYNYITPKLADLVDKIRNINVPTYLAGAASFAASPVGSCTIALGTAIALLMLSQKADKGWIKATLLVAGVSSLVFSAVVLTKPFSFMKA